MGVQNLWVLLAPVGRQIEIESLASQVLAVDASIWLTQFVKAMRDDEGNMIKNAHLLGTFHRVAKLLFYRIRPVFVFDGNTPELKRRTVARRRKRQDHQAANLRQTAQRILLNRLKLYREELKKNGGKPVIESAVAPNFVIPGLSSATGKEDEEESKVSPQNGDEAIVVSDDDETVGENTNSTVSAASGATDVSANDGTEAREEGKLTEGDDEEVLEESSLTIDDIDLGSSRLTKVDLDAVFALPPHLQKDMLNRIMRDRRQEVRDQFIPLAGNPEAYSHTQITSFLETSKLNRRIENARQKNAQAEMQKVAPTTEVPLIGHGKRIASSSDRFFIYQKADGPRQAPQGSDIGNLTRPTEESIVNDASDWRPNEDDDEIFARLHGPRRKRQRFDEDSVTVKRSLTDFSVESVKEFTEEVGRMHHRKAAVEEARQKFLSRLNEQQKPLEIEIARKEREETKRPKTTPNTMAHDEAHDVAITLKDEEVADFDQKLQFLLGTSASKTEESVAATPQHEDLESCSNDSDDDIEWEPVSVSDRIDSTATLEHDQGIKHLKVSDSPSSATLLTTKTQSDIRASEQQDAARNDNQTKVEGLSPVASDSLTATTPDAVLIPGEEEMDSNTDDLFAALKGEIEEEKAEDDLVALRQEALKSAIATASSLTQWAAGAVRRALAVHTQDASLSSPKPHLPSAEVHKTVIDLSQDDNVDKEAHQEDAIVPSSTSGTREALKSSEDGLAQDDDKTLREAIEKSLAEDNLSGTPLSSRYLQYSSIETVDVNAIEQEQVDLKKLRNRQKRDMEGVNDEMVSDVMELLRLFGVPYLVCPMEAEAQCAALEQLGLVDGIITDDSDIFPFGGRKVYKNIFHNQKFVEAFFADDIEKELGFSQEEMISLALLLGSDYTDGIRGIGIVNATEVVTAYPGVDGLREFKEWVLSFDVGDEALRQQERKKNQEELDKLPVRERFNITHSTARRRWDLGEEFPNPIVVQAYKNPQVDRSDARFSWGMPDLPGLREYCTKIFGWEQATTDRVLLPLMEQFANQGVARQVQTRIDNFFRKYDDNVKFAKIQSKRLRSAVEDKTQTKKKTDNPSPAVSAPQRKGALRKTKKTTQTLGL